MTAEERERVKAARDAAARRRLAAARARMGRRDNYCRGCGCHHETQTIGCGVCYDRIYERWLRNRTKPGADQLRAWCRQAGAFAVAQNAERSRARRRVQSGRS